MRQLLLLSGLCLLSACSGDNLDTPIKTCKAVASVVLGYQIPATTQEKQQKSDKKQMITLSFQAADEKQAVNVACTYKLALVGEDSEVELFGQFERVPSIMIINGQSVPQRTLFDAINQATVNAGRQVAKDVNKAGAEILNNAKETGKKVADDVNDFIQKQ
jgi:hypothetical protein